MSGGRVAKKKPDKEVDVLSLDIKKRLSAVQWSSPLPPPDILEAYSRISPDLLSAIVRIIEGRNTHNSAMESSAQLKQYSVRMAEERTKRISILAFLLGKCVAALIALAGFALCGYFVRLGYPKLAALLCSGELAVLVALFMKSRQSDNHASGAGDAK